MGWKGAVRSIGAEIRRAEREAQRRQRELVKRQKEFARMEELEQAAYEVDVYENRIALLTSIHRECSPRVDWNEIASRPKPVEPERRHDGELKAKRDQEEYQPSFVTKLFKREEKQRAKLAKAIESAKESDARRYEDERSYYEASLAEWDEAAEAANRVLAGEAEAYLEVIREMDPFSDMATLGSHLSFGVPDPNTVEVILEVHDTEVIPQERKSLLKSGKLSVRQMPKGQFFGYYQDYVCGAGFRIARELTSLLPVKFVAVHAVAESLNTATGHLEKQTILSAAFPRATLEKLNIEQVDPSDAIENVVHNMDFKKTKGFAPVDRVDVAQFANSDSEVP